MHNEQATSFTKDDLVKAAAELGALLVPRNPTDEQVERIHAISQKFGHVPAINNLFKDDYDRKMTHSGFGSPDCSCHIATPCGACIEYTSHCQTCNEELLEDEVDLGKTPICRPCFNLKSETLPA